jgi:hypothetical protein
MAYNNYNINENVGDSTTRYRGETVTKSSDFVRRYCTDNDNIKEGYIAEVFAGGNVAQVTYGDGGNVMAVWLSPLLGGFSGTNSISTLSAGTRVLVWATYKGGPAFILGAAPEKTPKDGVLYEVEDGKSDYFNNPQHNYLTNQDGIGQLAEAYNSDLPLDLLPGDWGQINEFGNVIALLRGLLILKATDLSQIQINTIDDLLRFIGRNIEVFSSMGTDITYDAYGKSSREINYSTSINDSLGSDEDISKTGEDRLYELDNEAPPKDKIRLHIGHVGDLIHLYAIDGDAEALSEIYIKSDGGVTVRSKKSLEFNRTKYINLPVRTREYHEDSEIEEVDEDGFADATGSKETQDSDRNTWTKDNYDVQSYHEDNWTINETVRDTAESTFQLKEDGSFLLKDDAGAFIETDAAGNMTISCPGNLMIRTGKDIVNMSGGDVTLRANKNLDICCTEGDIRVKAEEALQFFSRNKGVLVETDSSHIPDTGLNEAHKYGGILLRTNQEAPISLISGQNINSIASENNVMEATFEARMHGSDNASIFGDVISFAKDELMGDADSIDVFSTAINMSSEFFKLNSLTSLQMESLTVNITANTTGTFYAPTPGVIIPHTHARDGTWQDIPDGGGGLKVSLITPVISSPIPVVITPSPGDDLDTLMFPFTNAKLALTAFSFRADEFTEEMFEQSWQRSPSDVWDLITNDTFQGTHPFPYAGYQKYKSYAPTGGTSSIPGPFSVESLATYKI